MNIKEKALQYHKKNTGKLSINSSSNIDGFDDLKLAYTPGVAEVCKEIYNNNDSKYEYTIKGKTAGIITNGTAVLGLGNIGADAALPVMEGKALLLKKFANVDAFPICIKSDNADEFINIVKKISSSFGAINLEDISAPDCFYIEKELQKQMDIPIFHDDRHGTSIVILAGLLNCLRLTNYDKKDLKIVFSGIGAAGFETILLLNKVGFKNIYAYDKNGVLNETNVSKQPDYIQKAVENNVIKLAKDNINNINMLLKDANVFIGLSAGNIINETDIRQMAKNPWIFALANPTPEIDIKKAFLGGAYIYASGSNLNPNQINNALIFPGIIKAMLAFRIKELDHKIKLIIAKAIAHMIKKDELNPKNIVPQLFKDDCVKTIFDAIQNYLDNNI